MKKIPLLILCANIMYMLNQLSAVEHEEKRRIYTDAYQIAFLGNGGYVKPLEASRNQLEDFHELLLSRPRNILREFYAKFDTATLSSMKTVAGDKLVVEVIDEVIKER